MFQLLHQSSRTHCTIYSVHKSGPRHEQTKFLVFDEREGWRWLWAQEFQPLATEVQQPRILPRRTA